ncbi:hypothetical protein [Thermosulfurimonas dismutans]|uniref:Dolichol kinase n=1 Tax=Thermosulfurimonas dismutans TaxID=999894 RepID=A0A179D3F4_9BACT|nr:hypothetical protein [Thermosulfurimonas dismutans]OAQ20576.1 hypothetical protein TDIS_1345 [Thermosulfurimonas dismutans]
MGVNLRRELPRKLFHLSGLALHPLVLWLEAWQEIFWVIILVSITTVEVLRISGRFSILNRLFGRLMRSGEERRFSGAFYYFWGVGLAFLMFPLEAALVGLWVLAVGDAVAGLLIRGRSVVLFLCGLAILLVFGYPLDPLNILKVLSWTLVERLPRVNDNFTLPLVVALTLSW